MTSSSSPPRRPVLVVGLTVHSEIPAYFRTLYGTPAEIQAKIDGDVERAAAAGYEITGYQIREDDVPGGLRWVEDALRTRPYDAVVVGSGLRLIPAQTAVFEAVVNAARTLAPATPLLFNEGPGTNVEALERTFGKAVEAAGPPPPFTNRRL